MALGPVAFAGIQLHVLEPSTLKAVVAEGGTADPSTAVSLERDRPYSFELTRPMEVSSPSRIPVILVPVYSKDSQVSIHAPKVDEIVGSVRQKSIGSDLSAILAELDEVQALIRKRKAQEAMTRIQALETRYPEVKFLEFTRASIALLMGDREEALRIAESASKEMPDYEPGRRFVDKLKGGGNP